MSDDDNNGENSDSKIMRGGDNDDNEDDVSYSTGASRSDSSSSSSSDQEETTSSSEESTEDDSSSEDDADSSSDRETTSSSSSELESTETPSDDLEEAEEDDSGRTEFSSNRFSDGGDDRSERSKSSATRSSKDDGGSESSRSSEFDENQASFAEESLQQLSSKSMGASTTQGSVSFAGESNSEIVSSFRGVDDEGDASSADYTSGSDSTYDDESEKSSSVMNDDSSAPSFASPWSSPRHNAFASSSTQLSWPAPHFPVSEQKDDNVFANGPPASSRSFVDAKDVDPFASTPVANAQATVDSISIAGNNFGLPPISFEKNDDDAEKRVNTVGFDLSPRKDDAGSVSTSKRSNRSNRSSSSRKSGRRKPDDWFGSASSMGSNKGNSSHKTATSRSSKSSRSRASKGESKSTDNNQTLFYNSDRSSSRSSASIFRSADPSGLPPARAKSYKLAANYTSQSGSDIDDSDSSSNSGGQRTEQEGAPNQFAAASSDVAFGFGGAAPFPESTTSAFSGSSILHSSSQDIEGFGSFTNVVGDDDMAFGDAYPVASTKEKDRQSHSASSIGSESRVTLSVASSKSSSRASRGKVTRPGVSRNTSAQLQSISLLSKTSQKTKASRNSSTKSDDDTPKKGSRMSISDFLPPRPIGNKQTSVMSCLTSKDTISRTPPGDEPSISLSEVFKQSPPPTPVSNPSGASRKGKKSPDTAESGESASSVSSKKSRNASPPQMSVIGECSVRSGIEILPSTSPTGLYDSASAENPTIMSGGTIGTAANTEHSPNAPANTFGASFDLGSVQSNCLAGELDQFEELKTSVKSSETEEKRRSSRNPEESSSSSSVSSSTGGTDPEESTNVSSYNTGTDQGESTTNISSLPGDSLEGSTSELVSTSRSPSRTLGSGTSFSQTERSSITSRSIKGVSTNRSSIGSSKSSRSESSSFSEGSGTFDSVSRDVRSPPSPFGEHSRSSRSQSSRSRSRQMTPNYRKSESRSSRAKQNQLSPRPQSAGDSSQEGSSHGSSSYSSKTPSWSFRDKHPSSSGMSYRSGSVSIDTYSSESGESRSTSRSTTSRDRARSKAHCSRSRRSSSSHRYSRNRPTEHGGSSSETMFDTRGERNRLADAFFFGNSVSLLKDVDPGLKDSASVVHATVHSQRFQSIVTVAYEKLCQVRPRLVFLLSKAEWLHIHCLLLYTRLFDCEMHFHKIDLPSEFQIEIPQDIQVLEPLAAVLSSVGIVEDSLNGVTYVPVPKPCKDDSQYRPHDPEDVTEFLEWTQKDELGYDWNASWERVELGRRERKQRAEEQGVKLPIAESKLDIEKPEEKLRDWNLLAVEKWLGWDDELWFSYQQACHVLLRVAEFSAFQRETKFGTYAWLLPRNEKEDGSLSVILPSNSLSADTWMVALMFGFCALPKERTNSWYVESNPVPNVEDVTSQFLESAIKTKSSGISLPHGARLVTVTED